MLVERDEQLEQGERRAFGAAGPISHRRILWLSRAVGLPRPPPAPDAGSRAPDPRTCPRRARRGRPARGVPLVPAVSPLVLALVLGAAVGTGAGAWVRRAPVERGPLWAALAPGTAVAAKHVLRTGVVLLGLRLSVPDVLALGWRGLTVVVVTLAVTFAGTQWAGRRLGVPREAALLVGTGFAVCGAAAVSAMTGVVERSRPPEARHTADADAVAAALALVTVYGTVAVFVLPPLARAIGLDDARTGLWIGASVQEVAQVVAAAGAVSAAALATATIAKLARVALLAPIVAGTGAVLVRREPGRALPEERRTPPVPLFVLGFLVAVAARSTGLVPAGVLHAADALTTVLFVVAMVALGLGVDVPRLVRTGRRTLLLGGISALLASSVSLAGVLALG
ncbi:YeiH family protein [Xylanimonas allomyrinae]|uniref:YeiH family protein n=1 Tax=Xylanimonas allomyrinae TaxID=2509459 RepID=UPI001B85F1B5|nr:putative sulfate exporter family transporter [Xylanimonas allomyrinae]